MSKTNCDNQSKAGLIWTIAVAIFGVALYWVMFYQAGYGSGFNDRKAQVESQNYASTAARDIEQNCVGLAPSGLLECITKVVESERESQRGESDLAAQWKAADWVMWAGVIGAAQLIATAVGLYYVKRTLDATLVAVADTSKATQAMERQNEMMADSRLPDIYFDKLSLNYVGETGNMQPVEGRLRAESYVPILCRNTTDNYCRISEAKYGYVIAPSLPDPLHYGIVADILAGSALEPRAQSARAFAQINLSATEIDAVASGNGALFFWLKAVFEDTSGNKLLVGLGLEWKVQNGFGTPGPGHPLAGLPPNRWVVVQDRLDANYRRYERANRTS